MKTLLFILLAGGHGYAQTKIAECVYKSGPDKYNKFAQVEYVRNTVIKSLWFGPTKTPYYEDATAVDGCHKVSDRSSVYRCGNPLSDIVVLANFNGQILTVYQGRSVTAVFSCSPFRQEAK